MTIIPNLVQHLPPITHHHLHPILGNTIMTRIANPFPHNVHIQLYMMTNPCLIHFTIIHIHMGSTTMNNMTHSSHHNLPNHPLMSVIFARHQIHRHVLRTLRKMPLLRIVGKMQKIWRCHQMMKVTRVVIIK